MRIHSDLIDSTHIYAAARESRVSVEDISRHGSRSRDHAYNVNLSGESRRRPNRSHAPDEYAATWDQWGVFLAHLFDVDPNMTVPTMYKTYDDFTYRTYARFTKIGGGWDKFWPEDAHGDHRFEYMGFPGMQGCTKCSAVQRWM